MTGAVSPAGKVDRVSLLGAGSRLPSITRRLTLALGSIALVVFLAFTSDRLPKFLTLLFAAGGSAILISAAVLAGVLVLGVAKLSVGLVGDVQRKSVGGLLLGVACFLLVRVLRRPRAAQSLRLGGGRGRSRRAEVAASRSFLVDIHLLKDR